MSFEALQNFTDAELGRVCFERGIDIQDTSRAEQMKDLKLWLAISNLRNVPHSLLFYSRIQDMTDRIFEISEDEDEFEVLRRVTLS